MNMTTQISNSVARKDFASGQAMVELAVALVVVMVLLAGLIQVGRLANARTGTMMLARERAGRAAMSETYRETIGPMHIFDWRHGPDGRRYTADDIPLPAAAPPASAAEIASAARAEELSAFIPGHAFSGAQQTGSAVEDFFFVHGRAHDAVSTLPVIRRLVYGRPAIPAESRVWLVWTGGIY